MLRTRSSSLKAAQISGLSAKMYDPSAMMIGESCRLLSNGMVLGGEAQCLDAEHRKDKRTGVQMHQRCLPKLQDAPPFAQINHFRQVLSGIVHRDQSGSRLYLQPIVFRACEELPLEI